MHGLVLLSLPRHLVEHVLALVLHQVLGRPLDVDEQLVGPGDVLHLHRPPPPLLARQGGGGDQVDRVPQGSLHADLGEEDLGVLGHLHLLLLGPDVEDLAELRLCVGLRGDDQEPVEEVDGDAVRGPVAGAADGGDAPVGGGHEDRGHVVLQGPVEEGEALDVEHVDLVDEQHPGDDLCLPLLPPLGHLRVDLLPHLRPDLPGVTSEERQKALGSEEINAPTALIIQTSTLM